MARLGAFVFVFGIAFVVMLGAAQAERRAALVIGINAYDEVAKLEKAVGDAKAMADKLRQLGFDVTELLDADRRTLNQTIATFSAALNDGDTAFVHFSGHGVEIDGENYLLPSDVPKPASGQKNFVKSEAIAMSSLIGRIAEAGARTRVFVIDACRDNPFEQAGVRSVGNTRGLARVEAPAGTFIMYSAGYRQTALDRMGEDDAHATSVYTRTLLKYLGVPGKAITDVAQDVRGEVEKMAKQIGHNQRPAYYDELSARLILVEPNEESTPPTVPPTVASNLSAAAEAWAATKETESTPLLETFIKRFEGTYFADIARIRLNELQSQQATTAPTPPDGGPPAPVTDPETAPEQKLASLPDPPVEPAKPEIAPRELARSIQVELDRLGCAPGKPDGIWGKGSRSAVKLFNKHAVTKLASTDPSPKVLGVLKGTTTRVCPPQSATPAQSATLAGCIRLNVQSTPLDRNNQAWDPFPGSTAAPDITVYDANSRAKLFGCIDSYTCAGTLNASGATINLLINDDDYDAPDAIGNGQCSLSRPNCTIGLARLQLSPC